MLNIKNLHVNILGKEVLKSINLKIKEGKPCILFGINGSGKTSLLLTIMGFAITFFSKAFICCISSDR